MPPSRPERYNAKARRSIVGGSSHKRKKNKKPSTVDTVDPNAEVLEHRPQEEKEATRREVLRQELLLSTQGASGKKKKRLEKYIEKQLKKEERVVILQNLAASQAQVPSSLHLQSSSTLGTGRPHTAGDKAAKDEDSTVRRALSGQRKGRRSSNAFGVESMSRGESDASESESDTSNRQEGTSRSEAIVIPMVPKLNITNKQPVTQAGGALKRNPDGTTTAPVMLPRKQKKALGTKVASWNKNNQTSKTTHQAEEDSDFDSSDSENDSGSEQSEASKTSLHIQEPVSPAIALEPPTTAKKRSFKDWAKEQITATLAPTGEEYTTFTNIQAMELAQADLPAAAKRPKLDQDQPRGPMGARLDLPNTSFSQAVQKEQKQRTADGSQPKTIQVNRSDEVRASRILLPILAEEQRVIEAVLLHPVVVICGETGSGKTTQVPQFLYEAGFGSIGSDNPGMIGITQPRRVAAVSMAARVAHELSLSSAVVSHQIRYDATTSSSTIIKFMTDGVLLREMATDFLLSRYSVIIVDEAHERNLNTDILIGTLSRVIKLREEMWRDSKSGVKPLRLIIMSATLRVSDFVENKTLFDVPPPIVQIDARQHPVTIHFDRRTRTDYVTQAVRKAIKIHTRLPAGGILIFLTGQQEIHGVCKKLESTFGIKVINARRGKKTVNHKRSLPPLFPSQESEASTSLDKAAQHALEVEDIELGGAQDAFTTDVDEGYASDAEALDTQSEGEDNGLQDLIKEDVDVPMHVVPLYSLLASKKQMAVFEPPPEGSRLVVVATNVAETSLTIPGIRYVIDCGRAKERLYDVASGVQAFRVSWISKASAAQRAGRAGRTGPGHCYRLYSSSLYEHYFDPHSAPEILRTPIDGIVLQMKSMHIDAVVNFPYPTPPDRLALKKAELVLTRLGALEVDKGRPELGGGHITQLGRTMSMFPVNPRFGKMLANGMQHGCLPYVIAIVSGLSVGDPFLREDIVGKDGDSEKEDTDEEDLARISHLKSEELRDKEKRKSMRRAFYASQKVHSALGNGQSDIFKLLSVIGAYEFAGGTSQFCTSHFVRPKAMEEIHKLRAQISSIVATNFPDVDAGFIPTLKPPTTLQIKVLRQLLAAGFIDQIAVRKDIAERSSSSGTKYASSRGIEYRAVDIADDVFIHPSSALFHMNPPEYVAFQEVVRGTKVWIKNLTVVNPSWLAQLGPALCTFSKPIPIPPTIKDMKAGEVLVIPKYGPGWELPPMRRTKIE